MISKWLFNVISPKLAFSLKSIFCKIVTLIWIISHIFKIIKRGFWNQILINFLQHLLIVNLNKHSFTHTNIRHNKRMFFKIFNHNELSFRKWKWFSFCIFYITILHLTINNQIFGFYLSWFIIDYLDYYFIFKIIVIWKFISMKIIKFPFI